MGESAVDRAGDGEDFSALFIGVAGRDQRTRAERRFDDDCADREAADDAVALRKLPLMGTMRGGDSLTTQPAAATSAANCLCSGG